MYTIENEVLAVSVRPKGAELTRIFHKANQLDYLWNGDPAFWGKYSPVLFPIVGALKDNTYFYRGKTYHLPRHGFARDREFTLLEQSADALRFSLRADDDTRAVYPFGFECRLHYLLAGNTLAVTYEVLNTGDESLYFSIGGHPAFRLPLAEGTVYTDYYLAFNEVETCPRWPISPGGLIEKKPRPLLQDTDVLPLTKELFYQDAIVLKHLNASMVTLSSEKTKQGWDFDFSGFPYLGIWAARDADFVCVEPWCGIADNVDSTQQLENKEGINHLAAGERFERTWKLTLW